MASSYWPGKRKGFSTCTPSPSGSVSNFCKSPNGRYSARHTTFPFSSVSLTGVPSLSL